MYIVTGANLFGQWFSWSKDISVFEKFEPITFDDETKLELNRAKLITCCWSYNIFEIDNTFYISGAWREKDKQLIKAPVVIENKQNHSNLLIAGNDYMLVFVEQITRTVWFYDLESEDYKKVNFIEEPIEENAVKKSRATDDIIKVAVSHNTFIYLSAEGNVYTGQLPSFVDTRHCVGKVCNVECGYEHYMLLTDEGRVYTWGNGRRLQLGHGDLTNMDEPTEVQALSGINIVKIQAGGWHSLALSKYGDLYAWGWNDTGQLGIHEVKENVIKNYTIPTLVDLFDDDDGNIELNIKDIAAGSRHSAVLLEDNTVWTTGCNKYGQLGFPPKELDKLDYFKKAFQSPNIAGLSAGPWSTVVEVG